MEDIMHEYPNRFSLPKRIERLGELAYNIWWVWNPEAQSIFYQIDKTLWDDVHHNPVAFLRKIDRASLNAAADDRFYLDFYNRVFTSFDNYMQSKDTWFSKTYPHLKKEKIAYFSFEFGLHESLPVYAGGLGVLSGDHLKEASDLGIPLSGVGFIYRQGYFTQHITEGGWQETGNYLLQLDEMPIIPLFDAENKPLMVSVELPERRIWARIWAINAGRVSLYLLDSEVEENSTADRQLTARIYSNDLDIRISQEILLGIGGAKALALLEKNPTIWHMNEGHSAFLSIQRLRDLIADGETFETASEKIRKTNIFTTHTPVPAGNDQFPLWMMDKYFSAIWPELNLTRDQFIDLGKHVQPWGESFSMPVLALKLSNYRNGVSELHGQVSRHMWNFLWPDRSENDVPISHITNGIHTTSWIAERMRMLFDRYFGHDWVEHADDPEIWQKIEQIPDAELWGVHQKLKDDLLTFATRLARKQWLSNNFHPVQIIAGGVLLDHHALTIGFARRFATYKRAYLLLHDFERLLSIINNVEMPVQIIFAGKAHPADEPGKLIIQQIYRAVKDSRTAGRMVFLEDYDMNIARYLVQGVDVWLNTPRQPNEASGTSGMKAALNGVLNLSITDGWWREGYNGENGWKIGSDIEYEDANEQDTADAESLYDLLENEIAPLYYKNRYSINPPTDWISRMKDSIRTLAPQFSTKRMVKEYLQEFYLPALNDGHKEKR
ncbi:MAG: alpha-glucan family phosphorylase [Anaerolineaceae bacterium]|nr:alpha-glucan family phosphorylase [Anaerolineaceae bacterium]